MSTPTVEVRDAPARHRFEAHVGDELVGVVDYRRTGEGALALTHAEVAPQHGGRGIGTAMVRATLDDLAARDERIVPLCSFVRAVVRDEPAYHHLVA